MREMDAFGFIVFFVGLGYLFNFFATGMLVHAHMRCTPAVHMMKTNRDLKKTKKQSGK